VRAGHSSANGTAAGGLISIAAPHLGSGATYEAAGGEIHLLGNKVILTAANVSANKITVGGHDSSTPATEVYIDRWSTLSGNQVEIWAEETVHNLASSDTPFPSTELQDPNPHSGTNFGSIVVVLSNGNIVVTKPDDQMNIGSVFLYDGTKGGLPIYTLSGSTTGDQVGSDNVIPLTGNSNFVVLSPDWQNSPGNHVGAVTWVSGTASGTTTISSANSLTGSSNNDLSSVNCKPLSKGNFVVTSPSWNIPLGNTTVGAATWGSGTTGVAGTISAANSLIGSSMGDQVGTVVTALTNGNYVATTSSWNSNRGAATWGSGTGGVTGTVSAGNSLVGFQANDQVSNTIMSIPGNSNGIAALANGSYVILSPNWQNGVVTRAGAATWGNGTTGTTGTVSIANSLVGETDNDAVGTSIAILTDPGHTGNYVVGSSSWTLDMTHQRVGAATWSSGSNGITGTITAANSLIALHSCSWPFFSIAQIAAFWGSNSTSRSTTFATWSLRFS